MTTQTDTPATGQATGDDKPVHLQCCVVANMALCGSPLSGPRLADGHPIDCRVCDYLLRENFCPLRQCPALG